MIKYMSNTIPPEDKTAEDVPQIEVSFVGRSVKSLFRLNIVTVKFVLAIIDEVRHLIFCDDSMYHKDMVPSGATLVGGGIIVGVNDRFGYNWESDSCREKFGYDQPANPNEADAALKLVRETFTAWMKAQKEALAQK